MGEIELVVKMNEEDYKKVLEINNRECEGEWNTVHSCYEAILNGTPLPKGHKRLIEDNFDVGPVFDEEGHRISYKYVTQEDLNNALTIIPADEEGKI